MSGFLSERVIKPLVLAVLTFLSVRYLTGDVRNAIIVALIPLILGVVNMLQQFAYSLAALSLIAAIAWAVVPVQTRMKVAASVSHSTGIGLDLHPVFKAEVPPASSLSNLTGASSNTIAPAADAAAPPQTVKHRH